MTAPSSSTSALAPLLPPYLYELSPTIHKWCALRCADIVSLTTRGVYFEDKLIHHYLNHPIRYIKLIGLIVSIDTFARRRVYTIDDSSGNALHSYLSLPRELLQIPILLPAPVHHHPQIPWNDISECKVVRILGIIGSYMQVPQLQIVKMGIVGSTDVERKWWDECRELKDPERGILGREWVVGREEMERWRRRERRRKAREEEKRGGRRDGRAVKMKSGSGRREDTEKVEEKRELARKKLANSQPFNSNPTPSRPPHETSPNKPLLRPPIKKRFIPTILPDLSNYDTFGY
ncbi:uncharacterized protein Bfra_006728 [Botrytis fragariae]|uniref:CST complex subunit Stn1 N-terminal domain-containing protein n=1 Tax=Botrytis fragariae TaxID=1964551 RepID=A0A8H6B5A1_9HELO|nr:uncharacterized protein Bfra_006728 [Botrytis fragariae]KAF5879520.1 hypothetical protein Bfra_006728 [Botrytis fragariae]